ncbi:hypothetical protein [Corallibacter sp.]|uniref:hypothetical protein n=1 Tax=Corallibacter sp. TaxID=2038084 RepID=UPI003A8E10EC
MRTTIFVGAGFSKWSCDLPLVSDLFDYDISLIRNKDEIWFKKIVLAKEKWDKLNPNMNNELFIKDILEQSKPRIKKYLSKYLTRRLSEPFLCNTYSSIQTYMFNDSLLKKNEGINKAKLFFEDIGLDNIEGIITTNYDLICEYSLGTAKFNYGVKDEVVCGRGHNPTFPWQHTPVILKGNIVISKIHGSLSFDGVNYWSSGSCGLKGSALIVPPYPEKHIHPFLKREWRNSLVCLKKSQRLIVFGFNFNPYDIAVLDLLKKGSTSIKEVLIYDVESKMEKASMIWSKDIIKEFNISILK